MKLGLIITLNCIPPSHPVRVRGLKLICRPVNKGMYKVAPRAGAWVETNSNTGDILAMPSHPVRVRGLKRCMRLRLRLG